MSDSDFSSRTVLISVNGAHYGRAERVAPAPTATHGRTGQRLDKLGDRLIGLACRAA